LPGSRRRRQTPPRVQSAIDGEIGSRALSLETSSSEVVTLTRDTMFGLAAAGDPDGPASRSGAGRRAMRRPDLPRSLSTDGRRGASRRLGSPAMKVPPVMKRPVRRLAVGALAAAAIFGGSVTSGSGASDEPDVFRTVLPNGLRAIVRERPGSEGGRRQRRHSRRLPR